MSSREIPYSFTDTPGTTLLWLWIACLYKLLELYPYRATKQSLPSSAKGSYTDVSK